MKIIIEISFSEPLLQILTTIEKDKKSASKKFNRDLIFKGYTIIHKVEANEIKVLDIFKWQDR